MAIRPKKPKFAMHSCVLRRDDAKPHANAALPAEAGSGDYILVKAFADAWFWTFLKLRTLQIHPETMQR